MKLKNSWVCAVMHMVYYRDQGGILCNMFVLCGLGCNAYRLCSLSVLRDGPSDLLTCWTDEIDGLPQHVFMKCLKQLGSLEKAAENLVNFRSQGVSNGTF